MIFGTDEKERRLFAIGDTAEIGTVDKASAGVLVVIDETEVDGLLEKNKAGGAGEFMAVNGAGDKAVVVDWSVKAVVVDWLVKACLLYTSPSPRDGLLSRMPSSA